MLVAKGQILEAMNERCLGMRSVGRSPVAANDVKFIVGKTGCQRRWQCGLTLGEGGVVGEVKVHRVVQREVNVVVKRGVGSRVELGQWSLKVRFGPRQC